jgi:hypothetical protein
VSRLLGILFVVLAVGCTQGEDFLPTLSPPGTTSPIEGGGNCTSGYSPCLVYHGGADYDCYGGSGKGPYYTEPGVVYTVSGSDPYDLDDNDNDDYGCE